MTLERRTIIVTALVTVVVGVWFAVPGIASPTSPDGGVADGGANNLQEADLSQGYKVSLNNVTIRTWCSATPRSTTLPSSGSSSRT